MCGLQQTADIFPFKNMSKKAKNLTMVCKTRMSAET